MDDNKKTVVYLASGLLGLGLIYYMAAVVVPKAMVTMTRAAPQSRISYNNTKVLGAKLLAKADGKDKCLVNVFVMDETYKGIANKRVELSGMEGIKALGERTDSEGRISFEMTSATAGQFTIEASVEGVPLPMDVRVTFRN